MYRERNLSKTKEYLDAAQKGFLEELILADRNNLLKRSLHLSEYGYTSSTYNIDGDSRIMNDRWNKYVFNVLSMIKKGIHKEAVKNLYLKVIENLKFGVEDCRQLLNKEIDEWVTAPDNKESEQIGKTLYLGHTKDQKEGNILGVRQKLDLLGEIELKLSQEKI